MPASTTAGAAEAPRALCGGRPDGTRTPGGAEPGRTWSTASVAPRTGAVFSQRMAASPRLGRRTRSRSAASEAAASMRALRCMQPPPLRRRSGPRRRPPTFRSRNLHPQLRPAATAAGGRRSMGDPGANRAFWRHSVLGFVPVLCIPATIAAQTPAVESAGRPRRRPPPLQLDALGALQPAACDELFQLVAGQRLVQREGEQVEIAGLGTAGRQLRDVATELPSLVPMHPKTPGAAAARTMTI